MSQKFKLTMKRLKQDFSINVIITVNTTIPFMLNNDRKKEQEDMKEKLSQPSIRLVQRMPLFKGAELIKKMSSKAGKNLTAFITKK